MSRTYVIKVVDLVKEYVDEGKLSQDDLEDVLTELEEMSSNMDMDEDDDLEDSNLDDEDDD